MAGMGPAPKHPSQRRRTNSPVSSITRLPFEGRPGIAPDWPMPDAPTPEQRRLWAEMWHTPQAVAWERLGWNRVVCRYVRLLLVAESTFAAAHLNEVRQMEDRLGLSPMAMRRLGWEIEGGPDLPEVKPSPVAALADYRAMVDDGED